MSLLGVLGVVFIVLKLVNVIAWSWWLVLLPWYIGIILWVVFVLFAGIMVGTVRAVKRF